MTRTGTFMRFAVRPIASRHWAALSLRKRPESSAATKTPVPAAESQLSVNFAASGLASGLTTGGVRWTLLCRCGISHAGSESFPLKGDPRSVVLILTFSKTLLSLVLKAGIPQSAQHRMRIAHGVQAPAVCPDV